jgi:Tfp pilus assembly protein PilO
MSIIFILASLGLFFFYAVPKYNGKTGSSDFRVKSVKELKIDQTDYQGAIDKSREIEDVRNGLLTRFNSVSADNRLKISKVVPAQVDSVRLIIDVNTIAARYGLSLGGITITDSPAVKSSTTGPTAKEPGAVEFGFSVSGGYDVFVAFLKDVERSLRILDLNSITVSTTENKTDYNYRISLRTYRSQ